MEAGKSYDVVTILSTTDRDFLVRNNGDKVKIESLRGKFVAICFIPSMQGYHPDDTLYTVEAYKELYPKGDFEIVLVAGVEDEAHKDRELFNICFSYMPWLAVPFYDQRSRKRLRKLGNDRFPNCVLLDATGKVLSTSALYEFDRYGADWYPFTEQKKLEIGEKIYALSCEMSLTTILSTHNRNFLITNKGKKVPVSVLEGKVVGLFFYSKLCRQLAKIYAEVYKQLKERGENFEIVLYNNPSYCYHEISFLKDFGNMPWLALPYMDPRSRTLDYICSVREGSVVIVEPGKKQMNIYGADVIRRYGIEAYPFTSKKPAEMEMARLKALTLQSILLSENRNFVLGRDGSKVPISKLVGKNILVFIAEDNGEKSLECLLNLLNWYKDIKSKDNEFEVIYVPRHSRGCCEDIIKCDLKKPYAEFSEMPWLSIPDDKDYIDWLCGDDTLKIGCSPSLVAFGRDGRILTTRAMLKLNIHGIDAYPFTDNDLFMEIYRKIALEMSWHWPIGGVDEEDDLS